MTRREKLLESLGTQPHMIEMAAVSDSYAERKPYEVVEGVAVFGISGVLSNDPMFGDTSYASIQDALRQADADPNVKSIVAVCDSPGGSCEMAFETAGLWADVNKRKPICAVADPNSYSAMYLLASQSSEIWAPQTSGGVGSIGVYAAHADMSQMLDKMGIKVTLISAGEGKTEGNPYEPLSESAYAEIKGDVDRLYGEFVASVARGRKMPESQVVKRGARLYRGSASALGSGLADRVGTPDEAWYAMASKSSVASATIPAQEENIMADEPAQAEAQLETAAVEVVKTEIVPTAEAAVTVEVAVVDAETIRASAADVIELCVKAGLPNMAAALVRSGKSLDQVGADLQAARVAEDADTQIHSAVLSETGALAPERGTVANVDDSPIVKAASRLAQAGKGKS